jgi:seryl-tRNA synthetase
MIEQAYLYNKKAITVLQEIQQQRNCITETIGKLKRDGKDATMETEKANSINDLLEKAKRDADMSEMTTSGFLYGIPNIPMDDVPQGVSEHDNKVIEVVQGITCQASAPKNHWDLQKSLLDFDSGAKLSGSRFTVLKGKLAKLERAIGQYMLDNNTEFGYMEVNTPTIVNRECLLGTGQLPKFSEDLFQLTNGQYLIPTAEVTLTNLHNGELITNFIEPIRYTALTSCFRAEAGSAGKDTRGIIRQHQFNKVELVTICKENQWNDEFNLMLKCATNILTSLQIPFRVIELCTGDMGFSARKTYDIEVWLPGQNAFREISSISYCGDFQARRMKLRHKENKENKFLHTLNGSSLAVGRTLVAIMENYQLDDGTILIPEKLQSYTGFDKIGGNYER